MDTQNPSVLSIFPQAFNLRIGRADAPLVLDVRRQTHFDALLLGFDLHDSALDLLDTIVRGADTDQMGLSPQSAGLLAWDAAIGFWGGSANTGKKTRKTLPLPSWLSTVMRP